MKVAKRPGKLADVLTQAHFINSAENNAGVVNLPNGLQADLFIFISQNQIKVEIMGNKEWHWILFCFCVF